MNNKETNTVNGILVAVKESEYAELTKVTVFSRGEEEVFDLIGRAGYAKDTLLETIGIGEPIQIIWEPYRTLKVILSWDCSAETEVGTYPGSTVAQSPSTTDPGIPISMLSIAQQYYSNQLETAI